APKALRSYIGSMYPITGFLLLLLAAIASYNLKVFPTNLLIAMAACSLLDIAVKVVLLKKPLTFPSSALITGIIIGSIAPIDAPLAAVFAASAIAIASKHLIKLKGRHVFNPATLGLLVSLSLFKLGDVWWAAAAGISVLGVAVPLTLALIIANYKADKLRVAIPFLIITAVLYAATEFVRVPLTAAGLLSFAASMPYYFAFIMLSEPKTSPYAAKEQIVFGIAVALLYFALDFSSVKYPFLLALLFGNMAYALYRGGFGRLKSLERF
ncbi:RnfABCDGE type electron transport complex subunit D, partial [Candidatus Woesearchaeota archaeon]|nr:RnfABCDGE type electron transport complex subunit D [Candidatus Woesearchaeota archaeon]